MNKIYKVIWSKAKHTYVVASEIAKGHTKGETTGKGLKKLAAAMLVAAALLSPSFAWAEDGTVTVKDTSDKEQTVYTEEGAKNTFATIENLSTVSTEVQTQATQVKTNATHIDGLTTKVNALETADKNSVTEVTGNDAKLTITKGNGSTSVVTIDNVDNANHATSADSATTAESATKATQDGNGNVISTTYATKTEVKEADEKLDSRITAVKEFLQTETENRYVSKDSLASELEVKNAGVVKEDQTIGENVTNLGSALNDETAARLGADAAQDKVIQGVSDALTKQVGILNQQDANEAATRAAKDTELENSISTIQSGNTVSEDGNYIKASNTVGENLSALDTGLNDRITAVKEFLQTETENRYVSKDSLASELEVKAAGVVKEDQTIGKNVSALGKALDDETNARIWADKTQDKVIQQVNDNLVASVNNINTNMAAGFNALSQADANELAGRVAADTELVKATNGGLALNDKNVLQKNETTIAEDGTVTTKTTAADTLIMNEGKKNQITLSENGIKVGTGSTVIASDGVFAGGDTADAAKAALNADGSIKGANGAFTVDTDGNVASGNVTSTGTVKGAILTDGTATLQNGNLNTTGNVNAHDIVATGDISGKAITGTSLNTQGGSISGGAITGTSLNTQGGAINGGAITGTSINGTTGTFGSLTTTGNASVGGTLTTNTLKVNQNATVGGNLGVTGDITGKSLNVGTGDIKGGQITGTGLDVGAGTIKTTGAVETGTLTTTGKADIGGDLTVKGKLNVDEIDLTKTGIETGIDGDYHVTSSTKVAAGKITSYKKATSAKDGSEKESGFAYDENGTSTWAQSTDADRNWNKSTLTVEGEDVKSIVVDSNKNKNESTQTATESKSTIKNTANPDVTQKSYITQNLKNILQGIQNGTNATTVDQTETGIKSTATDGKNTASTNLSNKGFNTYATDGTNKTYTKQTATDIKNTAENGTISNTAKDLVNSASENMTNTVGKDLTTTVGGEMKTTVTGKTTENYNGGLETTVTGEEKHTVTGDVAEDYQSNMTTTVGKDQKTIVKGSQTNEISGSQTNTIGGSQTTTVTGDSSLTAENINNEAKNKITNKALDVETEASSSIVNKVSNDAGSNTSTQLYNQTTEEMSADGKTASYLRGAAEEKSQLTDGDKKTTIDTIAGQTNTNITDGKNISNNLQKADQVASSVTDGTNTTVVDQKATSLASSITDGTRVNNTSSTVDKSEQLIKVDDTHFYAETKTVDKAEEALKSGTTLIDIVKDTKTATVSSAVTDGKTITGISQNAKDINLSAAGGTIANSAKNISNTATEKLSNSAADIENKASNSILNQVGKNTSWRMTDGTVLESINGAGGQTNTITDTADSTVQNVKNGKNELTSTTSSTNADLTINNGSSVYTKVNTATGNKETVAEGDTLASTNLTKDGFNVYAQDENGHNTIINNASGTTQTIQTDDKHLNVTTKTVGSSDEKLTSGSSVIDVLKSFDDEGNPAATSTVTDGTNTSEVKQTAKDITNTAKNGTITNDAKDLVNTASNSITDKVGENVERTMGTKKITESVKDGTKSNIFTKTADKDINIVTDGTSTSTLSQLAGSVNTSLKNGTQSLNNVKTVSEDTTKITDASNPDSKLFSSSSQKVDSITNTVKDGTNTSEVKQTASEVATSAKDISNTATEKITSQIGDGTAVKSEMTADGLTNTAEGGTIYNKSKDILNEASGDIINWADGEIGNVATKITNITGDNTVTSDTNGTTFENTNKKDKVTFMGEEKSVNTKETTISGNTITTGEAVMDYADVMKDLGVRGNATIKGDTTMEGNASVGKDLTVAGKSTLTGDVTMKSNATVEKDLTVKGDAIIGTDANNTLTVNSKSTFNNGVTVKGGTTTDTLHVSSTATFDDIVTMKSDLNVGGNVDAASYKVDGKTYIDKDGINANNQVIKNVGQGDISEGSHDAVSGGQLYETNTRVSGLETRMGTVETKVDKLDNKIDKVGANAAAMANLHPLEFDEDSKWNIAAAVGSSGSETASAVGVFYRPNENVMVNASAAMGTGENMFGGGVSLRLGHGGNKAKEAQMKAAAKENRELRAKVDDLTARMDALLSVLNPNMSKDFPDVPENHWAYEAVSRLAGNGIVEGYEDGKYHGERQMTRYEMAEIIYNALSKGAKAEKKLVEEFRPELQAMAAQKKA